MDHSPPALFGDSLKAVVHGDPTGAATTMMVSGEKTPEYITCFVEDCGYTSVWDQFSKELKVFSDFPPSRCSTRPAGFASSRTDGTFRKRLPSRKWLAVRSPCFIHGDNDDFVPTWMVHKVYAAKPSPKEIWIQKA